MANPQWAMAQPGSLFTSRSNWLLASSYQKSCSRATPRLKGTWDAGVQEIEMIQVPSRSSADGAPVGGIDA